MCMTLRYMTWLISKQKSSLPTYETHGGYLPPDAQINTNRAVFPHQGQFHSPWANIFLEIFWITQLEGATRFQ